MKATLKPGEEVAPQPDELRRLPSIHSILGALNDPTAGVPQLRRYCAELPSLRNRIIAEARHTAPDREVADVGYALAIIGNRGFESVLLEYLEDLTVLKADIDDAKAAEQDARSSWPISAPVLPLRR